MEIETIAKTAGSYSSPEAPAVKPVQTETAAVNVSRTPEFVETTVSASENGTKEGRSKGERKEHQPSEATINDAVSSANRRMERTRCEYSYHKETNRVSIKVFDADTDEVIREIPPEKSLDMLQKMWEMAGILVDERR